MSPFLYVGVSVMLTETELESQKAPKQFKAYYYFGSYVIDLQFFYYELVSEAVGYLIITETKCRMKWFFFNATFVWIMFLKGLREWWAASKGFIWWNFHVTLSSRDISLQSRDTSLKSHGFIHKTARQNGSYLSV